MKIKFLTDTAMPPVRGTDGSAGLDLSSDEEVIILPGESQMIKTGVAVQLPPGTFGLLTHRSSLAAKLSTVSSLGIIDSDYTGEIKVILFNHSKDGVQICQGDRIAQLIVVPYKNGPLMIVDDLQETKRGAGGFGSTDED